MLEPIAIIGIGCRFPGGENPEAFWELLRTGGNAISQIPQHRWNIHEFYDPDAAKPGKMNTRWGGFLTQIDHFDPVFFGISPREARRMDPQQRLVLEVAWEALENAGISPKTLSGSQTGVFVGAGTYDFHKLLSKNPLAIEHYDSTGTSNSIIANRLSYLLDLRGPSLTVDTACSSSLVALHLACQSLRLGETDLYLVGGVNVILSPEVTVSFSKARMMAADGYCKTFDTAADGYVRGEGCGVVVLKRLSAALKDGDLVKAVIRGSAVNQDGLSNGLTAPNGLAQQAVIREALNQAGVSPAMVSYVEAHGTGTALGDPIEIKALKSVLMEGRSLEQRCWIGSVKTNIGHLEAAAGMAGLIKVVLALQHQFIPPHLHLRQLNPRILLEQTPFQIPLLIEPWVVETGSQIAGVSAFSFGGTNCHVIVEAPPAQLSQQYAIERTSHLLTLQAKGEEALRQLAQRYAVHLVRHSEQSIEDVCFTANTGRTQFDYRLALVTESREQMCQQLSAFAAQQPSSVLSSKVTKQKSPEVAFLFSGQGSQYQGMGQQLYETNSVFRYTLDKCNTILRPYLDIPLLDVLWLSRSSTICLDETAYSQPALFALEYSLVQLWRSWGITPSVVMGHGLGEYVAACVADVFSLEDALKLVAYRARLMQPLSDQGRMVAVSASESVVSAMIAPHANLVAIAATNTSEQFMEPVLAEFADIVQSISYSSPGIPIISGITGDLITDEIATPQYWVKHLRSPVQFQAGIQTADQQAGKIFIEIGPSSVPLEFVRQGACSENGACLRGLHKGQADWQSLLEGLALLVNMGVSVNWKEVYKNNSYNRVPLPTYPFQRQRFWID